MKIFNSLTNKIEEVRFDGSKKVGVYACGPTVYSYVTIGNWRTYVLGDLVVRTLKYFGQEVDYIMNITDVGHLTGDNLGDADTGEDRIRKAAKKEGKTAWDIAKFYTEDFLEGYKKLNLTEPRVFSKATEHIQEQIELVKKIEEKGFAYKISDGVYFDVKAYEEAGNKYGELSTLDKIKEGARVQKNEEKRDKRDFALWKFGEGRQMEWESPWGKGFPGWHIECSAMSMKYLGEQFSIHIGGEDLRSTHHANEVAQSEAGTGKKPFVKYWVHGAFLKVDGKRMGKSLGNAYTLHDIEKEKIDPLALRYLYLTGGYRDQLNFTWESLKASAVALDRLRDSITAFQNDKKGRSSLSEEKLEKIDEFQDKFKSALGNDLNTPQALAVLWEVVKSNIPNGDKYDLALQFDEVLGLGLNNIFDEEKISEEILEMLNKREVLRKDGKFEEADKVRDEILAKGYRIVDTEGGARLTPA